MDGSRDLYIALQPILDRRQETFGYELLFRSGPENFFDGTDADVASSQTIHQAVSVFGLDALVGDSRAFVNVTRRLLVDNVCALLPREQVIIELLETVTPDREVIAACRALVAGGYLLALDDFVFRPELLPLVDLAAIIKIDFLATTPDDRVALKQKLGKRPLQLLAEKVETREQHKEAMALGCEYFQGYYFCRPNIRSAKEVPPSKLHCLALFREVNAPKFDLQRIERAIHADPTLIVRLLRFLNSAAFAFRSSIASLRQAVTLLGEEGLRRWATVVVLAMIGDDSPHELILRSLQRARFCELLAAGCGKAGRQHELFLAGLLSSADVLVGRPLAEVLAQINCSPDIGSALLHGTGPLGDVMGVVLAFEEGRWDDVARLAAALSLNGQQLPELQQAALAWARQASSV